MVLSLPLFYETKYAQMSILFTIQVCEIIRFCVVWPFQSRERNIIRLLLEISLLIFFFCCLLQSTLIQKIMLNDPDTIGHTIRLFLGFGWLGVAMCFLFNIGHVVFIIYDCLRGCKRSNRELMGNARKIYYGKMLENYEKSKGGVPQGIVNRWIRLGNLNDRYYIALPDLYVRVQSYRMYKTSGKLQVQIRSLIKIIMNGQFTYRKKDKTAKGHKIEKRVTLFEGENAYSILSEAYSKFDHIGVEFITVRTIQKIVQQNHKPFQQIPLDRQQMFHKVVIESHGGHLKTIKLDDLMDGFPISPQVLRSL